MADLTKDEQREADRLSERLAAGETLTSSESDLLARSVGMTSEGLTGFLARCREHGEIVRQHEGGIE